jgi:hypothetical protein
VILKCQTNLLEGLQMFLWSNGAPYSSPIPRSVNEIKSEVLILNTGTEYIIPKRNFNFIQNLSFWDYQENSPADSMDTIWMNRKVMNVWTVSMKLKISTCSSFLSMRERNFVWSSSTSWQSAKRGVNFLSQCTNLDSVYIHTTSKILHLLMSVQYHNCAWKKHVSGLCL